MNFLVTRAVHPLPHLSLLCTLFKLQEDQNKFSSLNLKYLSIGPRIHFSGWKFSFLLMKAPLASTEWLHLMAKTPNSHSNQTQYLAYLAVNNTMSAMTAAWTDGLVLNSPLIKELIYILEFRFIRNLLCF
jgi:hypothetical protein